MWKNTYAVIVALAFYFIACSDENPAIPSVECSSSKYFSSSVLEESSSSSVLEERSSSVMNVESSSSNVIVSSSSEFSSSSLEQSSSSIYVSHGLMTDERDGQVYKTVTIGNQTWMAENLNYAYTQPINDLDSGSWCYNNDPEKCAKYGRLYTWAAAMDSAALFSMDGKGCGKNVYYTYCIPRPLKGIRGVCPESWHLPTESDMSNYIDYANLSIEILNSIKNDLFYSDSQANDISRKLIFLWSSEANGETNYEYNYAYGISIRVDNAKLLMSKSSSDKATFHSIRCVKDDVSPVKIEHGSMTDERDGQVYKTVTIGNQTWMAENLNYAYPYKNDYSDSLSWCNNNDPENCTKYGRLYTWDAAVDTKTYSAEFKRYLDAHRETFYHKNAINWHSSLLPDERDFSVPGSCPKNWHIPSENEWETLIHNVNNFATDLKSTSGWLDDGNGTDIYGFSVFPAEVIGKRACFWTPRQVTNILDDISPISSFESAVAFCLSSGNKGISGDYFSKEIALSVRCIKDDAAD